MGVCSSKKNNQNRECWRQQQSIYNKNYLFSQDKQSTCTSNQIPLQPILEPKEYDPANLHRQYNVLINGTLFAVVNSVEQSFRDVIENN